VRSPIDGGVIGRLALAGKAEAEAAIGRATAAFAAWRLVPAPQRGELLSSRGTRFDDRVPSRPRSGPPEARDSHADIAPAEIGKN
ncbi:aldehyde dehydrogenase family protein, partial [Mycobacterium tuberculosis]|nr:aldehyde dehydrogenase family protein [Mycobacterium tuberculosis]